MNIADPTGVLQRIIDSFKLDMTVEELVKRQRASGMEFVGVKESWGTRFSSVVEVTHQLINPDGSPRSKSDGTPEAPISRDYFTKRDHGAVAVLLYSPATQEVVLIQEPRPIGVLAGTSGLMLEVPTGGIGKGDKTAADAAWREAEKESGLPLIKLTEVASGLLASAGRIDERMSLFVAEVDLSKIKETIGHSTFRKIEADDEGMAAETGHAEFIRTHIIGYQEFFDLADTKGQMPLNAATWALATWFKGNHERLGLERASGNEADLTVTLARGVVSPLLKSAGGL